MSERDKFLTEAMLPALKGGNFVPYWFSSWGGFGKLWEWAIEQDWLEDFLNIADVGNYIKCSSGDTFDIQKEFINPDRFATAIYDYLNSNQDRLGNLEYHMSLLKKETP